MKRRFFAVLFMVFVSTPVLALDGGGIAGAPYLIQNLTDFQEFCADSSYWAAGVHTKLTTSLSLDGESYYTQAPIAPGTGSRYMGYFDGNSRTISDLTINGTSSYLGLFGRIGNGSTVSYLNLENVNIISSSTYIGGVCGENYYGTIGNCHVTGSVHGTDTYYSYVGGICGKSDHGTIAGCSSVATVGGARYAAGICSVNYLGSKKNCSVTGSVTGYHQTGGICGENSSLIENCYSTGTVRSVSGQYDYIGGICGSLSSSTVTHCFWDTQTSGNSTSAGGTGLLTSEMQTLDTCIPEWDFTQSDGDFALWFLPANDYPKLYLQSNMNCDGSTDITLPLNGQTTLQADVHTWLDATVSWTIIGGQTCPWIASLGPDNGTSTGPTDKTTVIITCTSILMTMKWIAGQVMNNGRCRNTRLLQVCILSNGCMKKNMTMASSAAESTMLGYSRQNRATNRHPNPIFTQNPIGCSRG